MARLTRSTARLANQPSLSPAHHRISASPITSARRLRLAKRPPISVPSIETCSHANQCHCGTDSRPEDRAFYHNGQRGTTNNITEKFLRNNLSLEVRDLDRLIGTSMALRDALMSACSQSTYTVEKETNGRFRIVAETEDAGEPGISIPRCVLSILKSKFVIDAGVADADLIDPFEHTADACEWETVDIDPTIGQYNLRLALHRAFLCNYLIPLLAAMLKSSNYDKLFKSISADTPGRPYFVYLAVKIGLGGLSATKLRDWNTYLLGRKVDMVYRKQQEYPLGQPPPQPSATEGVERDGFWEKANERLEGQGRRIHQLESASRVHGEMSHDIQRLTEHISHHDKEIGEIKQTHFTDIARLDEEINEHGKEIGEIKETHLTDIAHLDEEIKGHSKEIGEMKETHLTDIARHDEQINGQSKEMEEIKKRHLTDIARHDEEINGQSEEIEEIKKRHFTDIARHDEEIGEIKEKHLTDIARHDEEIKGHSKEIGEIKETHVTDLTDLRREMYEQCSTLVRQTVSNSTDIVTTRMEQLLSVAQRPIDVADPSPPSNPAAVDQCTIQLFLRLRNPTEESQEIVELISSELYPSELYRTFTSGEPTDVVSRAVSRGLSTSVPFIIALLGYSGGGKSYTTNGILESVLGYLPPVEISVFEVLDIRKHLLSFKYTRGSTSGITHGSTSSISEICQQVAKARSQHPTPANQVSSRAHLIIKLEDQQTGYLYGIIADVAGDEESDHRAILTAEDSQISNTIARNNTDLRSMMLELGTKGVIGFVDREVVSTFKRSSKLNIEISNFLGKVGKVPVIKLLYCADGANAAVVQKTMKLMPLV